MTTAAKRSRPASGRRACAARSGVWRGEFEAIVEDIRTPSASAPAGEEPQSETPQGRTGLIRKGLERGVQATETLVEGIDNAGVPDTPEGRAKRQRRSPTGPTRPSDDLEEAEDSLDEEADSLEAVDRATHGGSRGDRLARSPAACRRSPTSLELDPALAAAFRDVEHLPAAARGDG